MSLSLINLSGRDASRQVSYCRERRDALPVRQLAAYQLQLIFPGRTSFWGVSKLNLLNELLEFNETATVDIPQ